MFSKTLTELAHQAARRLRWYEQVKMVNQTNLYICSLVLFRQWNVLQTRTDHVG